MLEHWLQWCSNGAPETNPFGFSRKLCFYMLVPKWCDKMMPHGAFNCAWGQLEHNKINMQNVLLDAFRMDGRDHILPFGTSGVQERMMGTIHLNETRKEWAAMMVQRLLAIESSAAAKPGTRKRRKATA